jgi:hypothetical protein
LIVNEKDSLPAILLIDRPEKIIFSYSEEEGHLITNPHRF